MVNIDMDFAARARTPLTIRAIGMEDLGTCFRTGLEDFRKRPSHYVFLALIYPIFGIVLGLYTSRSNAFPLLYPLIIGFALIGPIAALGFYEISRREERGDKVTWADAFGVLHSPSRAAILKISLLLAAIFLLWLVTAHALFTLLMEPAMSEGFLHSLFATSEGWALIIVGNGLGLVFAAVAFSISVVSLPLILDRNVGAVEALQVSVEAVRTNLVPMAAWGLLVGALLILGSLPLLVGLAVVVPVLGHATWHLYRRVVV